MYRAGDLAGASVGTGKYHNLAEAIRLGCKLKPRKSKNSFNQATDEVCALAAAFIGGGGLKQCRLVSVTKMFPELEDEASHPFTQAPMDLWGVIFALNDESDYSREEIADWLCAIGDCRHFIGKSGGLVEVCDVSSGLSGL